MSRKSRKMSVSTGTHLREGMETALDEVALDSRASMDPEP